MNTVYSITISFVLYVYEFMFDADPALAVKLPDKFVVIPTSVVPPPPEIVIVLVAPVPDATTPDPTKLSVVPAVDKEEPSS